MQCQNKPCHTFLFAPPNWVMPNQTVLTVWRRQCVLAKNTWSHQPCCAFHFHCRFQLTRFAPLTLDEIQPSAISPVLLQSFHQLGWFHVVIWHCHPVNKSLIFVKWLVVGGQFDASVCVGDWSVDPAESPFNNITRWCSPLQTQCRSQGDLEPSRSKSPASPLPWKTNTEINETGKRRWRSTCNDHDINQHKKKSETCTCCCWQSLHKPPHASWPAVLFNFVLWMFAKNEGSRSVVYKTYPSALWPFCWSWFLFEPRLGGLLLVPSFWDLAAWMTQKAQKAEYTLLGNWELCPTLWCPHHYSSVLSNEAWCGDKQTKITCKGKTKKMHCSCTAWGRRWNFRKAAVQKAGAKSFYELFRKPDYLSQLKEVWSLWIPCFLCFCFTWPEFRSNMEVRSGELPSMGINAPRATAIILIGNPEVETRSLGENPICQENHVTNDDYPLCTYLLQLTPTDQSQSFVTLVNSWFFLASLEKIYELTTS